MSQALAPANTALPVSAVTNQLPQASNSTGVASPNVGTALAPEQV